MHRRRGERPDDFLFKHQMNSHELAAYLTKNLGEPVRIASVSQAFPGLSRETWLVRIVRGRDGARQEGGVVIRTDPPGGPFVPVTLFYEWQVYQHVARTDIPIAKPLWFDAAAPINDDRPLFVRELVEGETLLKGLNDDTPQARERRRRIAMEHADKLAALHRLDWKAYGFDSFMEVPESAEQAPRAELLRWWKVWEEVRTAPLPVVTEALHWFESHLPKRAAHISLCKGQNGIGEEIWRDDKIVALSDWELAHIGDPCQDLALSQGMLKLWDREKLIAYYESAAGFSLPPENISFYIVWNAFKSMLALNNGLRAFLSGEYPRLARATLGYGKVKVYEHLLGRIIEMDLEEAANFILQGQPNPYHDKKLTSA
jgi:aminoglycoside phosphotransferase (APT) family kinase protein